MKETPPFHPYLSLRSGLGHDSIACQKIIRLDSTSVGITWIVSKHDRTIIDEYLSSLHHNRAHLAPNNTH